jgi:hypothetical protein
MLRIDDCGLFPLLHAVFLGGKDEEKVAATDALAAYGMRLSGRLSNYGGVNGFTAISTYLRSR